MISLIIKVFDYPDIRAECFSTAAVLECMSDKHAGSPRSALYTACRSCGQISDVQVTARRKTGY